MGRHRWPIPALAAVALMAGALAATAGRADESARPFAREGLTPGQALERFYGLVDRLEGMLDDLPRYALPEIDRNGDIIIRRLPRRGAGRASADPEEPVEL